ncbi:CopD family protein [Pelistega sp. NLN82]|uniref:Protoporphyrinogen IX oxidase n=1 Tax=Pelistega ratti TaxID=2652177 RepID=A0A6L9Y7Z3_9BURK|nr:CopD family protein [Pelistega ratti]NEN75894.1 CopD family protein [Pelistega ratti]
MLYLWLKIIHIIFVTSWFAGLFYLPRIFVNLAQNQQNPIIYDYLLGMSKRLLRFMTIIAIPAIITGLWMMIQFKIGAGMGWLHAKLCFVFFILLYHASCFKIHRQFEQRSNQKTHIFFRWYNEIPLFLLLGVVAFVILKPF